MVSYYLGCYIDQYDLTIRGLIETYQHMRGEKEEYDIVIVFFLLVQLTLFTEEQGINLFIELLRN